ncbi:MAG: putative toxin-antitoxin system toxin component, PIN family [Gemmataceae bacterium]|nr:putative toxin-antitoxin system toxin component, PIN family [Gemmataceae bacterium]
MTNNFRIVVDTGVLVSAFLIPSSLPRSVLEFATERGLLLISEPTYEELDKVLNRDKFRKYFTEAERQRFLGGIGAIAQWVAVENTLRASRDPNDDKFLELAVVGHATHIVSSDVHLLELSPFQGIPVLSPRAFHEETRPS